MRLRALALLGGVLLLLIPAAAMAQSAGDEQYTDPLATPPASDAPSSNAPSSNTPSSNTPSQHAGTPSSSGDGTAGETASAGDEQSAGGGLPNTGLRSWMLALLGGLMLLIGLLLRLGLRPLPQRIGGGSPPTLGRDVRLTVRSRRR